MKASTILDTIGNTPHVRLRRLFGDHAQVWMKCERAGSIGAESVSLMHSPHQLRSAP